VEERLNHYQRLDVFRVKLAIISGARLARRSAAWSRPATAAAVSSSSHRPDRESPVRQTTPVPGRPDWGSTPEPPKFPTKGIDVPLRVV